jgi:hypothetical protein
MREPMLGEVRIVRAAAMLAFAAMLVAACGSEPKKDPTAATATAMPVPPPSDSVASAVKDAPADAGVAAKPDKQSECDALLDDANSTLDAERIAVDKLCKKDADCMPIKGRACNFNCVNASIPKIEEKDWNESLTKVKDGPCKKWAENECSKLKTKPPPTCQEKKSWCDKGHCALK